MPRAFAVTLAAFAIIASVSADDKKPADKDKPAFTGTWTRESNGLDLKVEWIGKETIKMSAFAEESGVIVTLKYAVKDGVVKAKVTDVEVKGDFKNKPPKGLELSFKWKVKGDTASLDDFDGEGLENAKPVVEGEYAKKKAKELKP
jgi:hypothetical protein